MAARVLVSDDLSPEAVRILGEAGLEVDVKVGLKPDALEAIVGGYDALAVRSATKVTARLLEKAARLKVVGRAGVGVDNVDLDAATRRGVVVMNTPGGSSVTVAELALGMILSLYRHVPAATASVKAGKWEKKRFQGREIAGKTLGVVGIGNIGSVLVDRALGMKMRVVAYDPFITPEAAAKLGASLVDLETLWREADAVSLHVPLTEQTRNLVNAATLARMKKGAILVNCSRGGIVDERAVAEALASGHLGGAALDPLRRLLMPLWLYLVGIVIVLVPRINVFGTQFPVSSARAPMSLRKCALSKVISRRRILGLERCPPVPVSIPSIATNPGACPHSAPPFTAMAAKTPSLN